MERFKKNTDPLGGEEQPGGWEGGLAVPEEQAFLQGGRQAGNLLSQAPCITSTAFCST